MKDKINIICLLWFGDFRRRNFDVNDVHRLYRSVMKHIDREFDFYCLTNDMSIEFKYPINKIELKYAWPGWWSKVELHRSDLPKGRTLYMDLDSRVVSDLSPILDFKGDLVMFRTRAVERKQRENKDPRLVYRYQAATMLFTPGCKPMKMVWDKFIKDPEKWMKDFRSEQDIMGAWIPDQPVFPAEWMVKLQTLKTHKLPKDVIIVTGQPKHGDFRKPQFAQYINELAMGGI